MKAYGEDRGGNKAIGHYFTKIALVLLSIALVGAAFPGKFEAIRPTVTAAATASSFTDTEGHWAASHIEQAFEKGYVIGFPDGTFRPEVSVTRAQFVKMVVDALRLPFLASNSGAWYDPYVRAGLNDGFHQREDFTKGDWNTPISRREMAMLSARAADGELHTVESSGAQRQVQTAHYPVQANGNKYTRTDAQMLEYYQGFLVTEAFKRGILQGFGGGEIRLDGVTTRAQAVVVIERILGLAAGKEFTVDKYAVAESELKWLGTNAFIVAPELFDDPGTQVLDGILTVNSARSRWMKEKLVLKNDQIHSEITEIIAVNLADPKDPNRKLLPALEKMSDFGKQAKVPSNAIVLIFKYKNHYNKLPNVFVGSLDLVFSGYEKPSPDSIDIFRYPRRMYSLDSNFSQYNTTLPNDNGQGIGAIIIPIDGVKFSNNGRFSMSILTRMRGPGNRIDSNMVFFGFTTYSPK